MARGTQLQVLVRQLRAEVGQSVDVSVNADNLAQNQQILRRMQEMLYDEYDWPFLHVRRDKTLAAGQRYYDFPSDLGIDRVEKAEALWNTRWYPLEGGITTREYNFYDSDSDVRSDPVLKWEILDTGSGPQFEVWPIPASNGGLVRFWGKKNLSPLVADSDTADLDDILIVLHAAAEILARTEQADAKAKLAMANRRLGTLRARAKPATSRPIVLGGGKDVHGVTHDPLRARWVP